MVSHDNVHLQTDKLGGKPRVSLNLPAREPILDGDALALDVSELARPCRRRRFLARAREIHRSERRPQREPAEESAPVDHSMTWSARSSTDCGIVRPSAFAAFMLMTSSNLVGCS